MATTYRPGDLVAWQGPKGITRWSVTRDIPFDDMPGHICLDAVDGSRVYEYARIEEVALVSRA